MIRSISAGSQIHLFIWDSAGFKPALNISMNNQEETAEDDVMRWDTAAEPMEVTHKQWPVSSCKRCSSSYGWYGGGGEGSNMWPYYMTILLSIGSPCSHTYFGLINVTSCPETGQEMDHNTVIVCLLWSIFAPFHYAPFSPHGPHAKYGSSKGILVCFLGKERHINSLFSLMI